MQIILKQDTDHLGYKNDVVKVRDGYARNFLIPKGIAMVASESNLKILKENVKQQSHKAEKMLAEAKSLAEKIQVRGQQRSTLVAIDVFRAECAGPERFLFGAVGLTFHSERFLP